MTPALFIGGAVLGLLALRVLIFRGPMRGPVSPPPTAISDMHCHTAGIGAGGSGAWISDEMRKSWKFRLYLRVFGSDEKTVSAQGDEILMEIIARSIRDSVHVDGAVILYSPRSPAVEKPLQDDVIEFFDLAKDKRDEAMQYVPKAFYPFTFKAGTFIKQSKPVHVFGLSTYFLSRPGVSDEQVYRVAKAILENTKEFAVYHKSARLWNIERTLGDPKLPFHNGAVKDVKDRGLWTPALAAKQKELLK